MLDTQPFADPIPINFLRTVYFKFFKNFVRMTTETLAAKIGSKTCSVSFDGENLSFAPNGMLHSQNALNRVWMFLWRMLIITTAVAIKSP
jgi:hypothetical protein